MHKILQGDSLKVLKKLEDNSVDLLCTDPPYGYSFMGKDWDKGLPDIKIFDECFRVLKPGAFAFVMSAPRSDVCSRMMLMMEATGFNIGFTPIYWTYASGFPKAMNIGKAVDKRKGTYERGALLPTSRNSGPSPSGAYGEGVQQKFAHTPMHPDAKALDGSYGGFQPKPAVEVVIVAMKPLSEKTYVDQALKNRKGVTWLDECRIPMNGETGVWGTSNATANPTFNASKTKHDYRSQKHIAGRFPANLLVSDDVLNEHSRFFSADEWAQTLPFLIVPKASKREKNEGLEDSEGRYMDSGRKVSSLGGSNPRNRGAESKRQNLHPTVKPLTLMSYLITLGSHQGDLVLDPFLGSGSTAIAAKQLGRQYIGVEREKDYVEIAKARVAAAKAPDPTLFAA